MSVVKKHFDWVKEQLEKYPELRDNNEKLYYRYLVSIGYNTGTSLVGFLQDMANREIPYIDSIARASRKVQENHPELRGVSYTKRVTKKEFAVREEIRDLKHY